MGCVGLRGFVWVCVGFVWVWVGQRAEAKHSQSSGWDSLVAFDLHLQFFGSNWITEGTEGIIELVFILNLCD